MAALTAAQQSTCAAPLSLPLPSLHTGSGGAVPDLLTVPCTAPCTACSIAAVLQDKETNHRIIVGKDFYEPQGIDPQVCGGVGVGVLLFRGPCRSSR